MDSRGGGVYLASRIFGRGVSTKRHKASQGVRGCKKWAKKRHVFCDTRDYLNATCDCGISHIYKLMMTAVSRKDSVIRNSYKCQF